MEALVELPGVGRKTANVVLGHALGVPGLPVDRHVLRVANRIGIAQSDDPEVVEQQLVRRDAAGGVDADVRHADPARPPHLQAASRSAISASSATSASTIRTCHRRARRACAAEASVTREQFYTLVEDALQEIPRRFRNAMQNVAVVVEDEPSPEHMLDEMEIEPGRHTVRALPGHAAARAGLGLRQQPARSDLDLPDPDRGGVRRPTTRSATASPRRSSTSSATTSG